MRIGVITVALAGSVAAGVVAARALPDAMDLDARSAEVEALQEEFAGVLGETEALDGEAAELAVALEDRREGNETLSGKTQRQAVRIEKLTGRLGSLRDRVAGLEERLAELDG
ncbi:MAG: hypothetical protein HY658_07215 [Actinobacteria bacterium]|nr:hypothetical protein [Actinomycetota bacterium]